MNTTNQILTDHKLLVIITETALRYKMKLSSKDITRLVRAIREKIKE